MRPKRVTRATPSSTAPEPVPKRRPRGGPRHSGATHSAAADDSDRGVATRTRAAKPSSSAPVARAKSRSSLTADPIPRRSAPRNKGELTIPSSPQRNEEDDDDDDEQNDEDNDEVAGAEEDDDEDEEAGAEEDDGEDDEAGAEEGDESSAEEDAGAVADQDEADKVDEELVPFMCQGIQNMADAAETILTKHRPGEMDKVQRQFFEVALDGLTAIRQRYIVHKLYAPFLHWLWLDRQTNEKEANVLKVALIPTNLVTLVEAIYTGAENNLDEAGSADADVLEIIDENFEDLVLGGHLLPVTDTIVNLALDIRHAYLLAALGRAKKNNDARMLVYHIFCSGIENPTPKQMTMSLQEGPYRMVAGLDSEAVNRRCRTRVAGFLKYIAGNNAAFANLATFRKRFPAKNLLATIQAVYNQELSKPIREARDTWARLQDPAAHPDNDDAVSDQADEFHDAAGELPVDEDDSSDDEDSQPIVRISNPEAGRSLFPNIPDLRALFGSRSSARAAPPPLSNQQASASRRPFPVDEDAVQLSSELPNDRRRSAPSQPSPPYRPKRTYDQLNSPPLANGSDDDDNPFETDTRPINHGFVREKRRRFENERAAREAERVDQRIREQQHQQRHMPSPRPAPPRSSYTTAAPAPARPRPSVHGGFRQRRPWSSYDEQVLLGSIERHWGRWSVIEREDKDLFEHPRDQQAYRDKARNMKVRMLLNDEPLPVGFDFVALGPKEKVNVVNMRKNPHRQEADIEIATGRVTNTEFVPGQAI